MIITNRRNVIVASLAATLLIIWTVRLLPWDYRLAWVSTKEAIAGYTGSRPPAEVPLTDAGVLPHIEDYFEQAFSRNKAQRAEYGALKEACHRIAPEWQNDVYLNCTGMLAGMTSIINQVKVCLKMAVDSGSNLVLPAMPLRDSTNLQEFNFMNGDAYLVYDEWFDAVHLREVMGRSCPKMKIVHPNDVKKPGAVKNQWKIYTDKFPGYPGFGPLFWVGNPYNSFLRGELAKLRKEQKADSALGTGITLVTVDSKFVLYRITDDPTGRELRIWNDLSRIIRFPELPREITNRLVEKLQSRGPYYGVHFRVENDTIWSSFEHQLEVDLNGLDDAWKKFGSPDAKKPVVYVACGDEHQAERFVVAGAERGWDVTHKWKLLQDDPETTKLVNSLAFDFQGAVDLGIMVRGQFFFGITGSAFSSTVSQLRDPTGRYRGSSLLLPEDAGAHSHLFFDGDAGGYPCCL